MKKTKKTKLHRRDYYYIVGAIGVLSAIAAALALTSTPGEAAGIVAHGERVIYHDHAILEYYLNGEKQTIPGDIGLSIDSNHPLASLGPTGIAPIHTHDTSGVIHIESKDPRRYTLADLLELWGLDLSGKSASLLVNNQPVTSMETYPIQDQDRMRLEVTAVTLP